MRTKPREMRRPILFAGVASILVLLLFSRSARRSDDSFVLTNPVEPEGASQPKRRVIEGLDTLWQLPPGANRSGVLFFAHGCSHSATDFWPSRLQGGWECPECLGLPEELIIRRIALARGYAFVAISSLDRDDRCWGTTMNVKASQDGQHVPKVLATVVKEEGLEGLPLYAAGASSGGAFALMLPHLMKLQGVCAQISALPPQMFEQQAYPPTLFVHMPRDGRTAGLVAAALDALAKAGAPAAEIRVDPRPVTAAWLSRQSALIPVGMAQAIVAALKANHLVDKAGFLVSDPRSTNWQDPINPHVGDLSLAADESQVSELLNVAYAMHEIVSDTTEAMLAWLEAGGKLSVDEVQQQLKVGSGARRRLA